MEYDGQIFFFFFFFNFRPFFTLLPQKRPEKSKFWKNEKTPGDTVILRSVPKIMIICYNVPEIWHVTDVIFIFHFELFLPFYIPNRVGIKKKILVHQKKNW